MRDIERPQDTIGEPWFPLRRLNTFLKKANLTYFNEVVPGEDVGGFPLFNVDEISRIPAGMEILPEGVRHD